MPYISHSHDKHYSPDELRQRIPGWGVDSDPAVRPAVPREHRDPDALGAHWVMPTRQPTGAGRERSIEHQMLTPVFGTAQPLHGVSGVIRRYAYDRYSEGRTAHWLLLVLGDRVDAVGSHLRSLASSRPDDPVTESGVLSERGHHPFASRLGQGRADVKHAWLDPIVVAGPWLLAVAVCAAVLGRILRRR